MRPRLAPPGLAVLLTIGCAADARRESPATTDAAVAMADTRAPTRPGPMVPTPDAAAPSPSPDVAPPDRPADVPLPAPDAAADGRAADTATPDGRIVDTAPAVDLPPANPNARFRIMPMGDSITESDVGYRGYLFQMLTEAGYAVDFVGSRKGVPKVGGDPDHEGRGGHTIGPDASAYCQWDATTAMHRCMAYKFNLFDNLESIEKNDPDFILLLIGINDLYPVNKLGDGKDGLLRPVDPKQAPDKLTAFVGELKKRKPAAKILVSSLLRQRDTTGSTWVEYQAINARARTLGEADAKDNVLFVDLNAIAFEKADFSDALHPSGSGGQKTAKGWFDALVPLMGGPQRAPATYLFRADFTAAAAASWTLQSATMTGGKLLLKDFVPSARAIHDAQSFGGSYVLRARLNSVGGGPGNRARVVFGVTDAERHFVEVAGGAAAKVTLGRRTAGASTTLATTEMPYPVSGALVTLDIAVEGDAVSVSATKAGATQTLFQGIATTPAEGKIGIEAEFNHVEVDELSVRKP